jgi:hypothetical protein
MGQKVRRADLEVAGPSWVWVVFPIFQTYTLFKESTQTNPNKSQMKIQLLTLAFYKS